jgi:hypothetical protein
MARDGPWKSVPNANGSRPAIGAALCDVARRLGDRDPPPLIVISLNATRSARWPSYVSMTDRRTLHRPIGRAGGNLLTDVANATGRGNKGRPHGLLYPTTSLAEQLRAALPESRVVKTRNTMLAPVTGASAIRFS